MLKKILILLFFFNLKVFSLSDLEKNTISKYLNFEIFQNLIEKTNVLEEKKLNNLNIIELNNILQKNWFQGKDKERWQFQSNFLEKEENNLKPLINNLFLDKNEKNKIISPDLIIVFGATFFSILTRALKVKKIIDENNNKCKIIFLTGYRKLDKDIDLNGEERKFILKYMFSNKKDIIEKLNENIELEEELIDQLKNIIFDENEIIKHNIEIFSEKEINGLSRRASTESTLIKFFNENNEILKDKKILGISNSKGIVAYQKSVVDIVLKKLNIENVDFLVEGCEELNVFFCGKSRNYKIEEFLDTIARIIYNCCKILQIN